MLAREGKSTTKVRREIIATRENFSLDEKATVLTVVKIRAIVNAVKPLSNAIRFTNVKCACAGSSYISPRILAYKRRFPRRIRLKKRATVSSKSIFSLKYLYRVTKASGENEEVYRLISNIEKIEILTHKKQIYLEMAAGTNGPHTKNKTPTITRKDLRNWLLRHMTKRVHNNKPGFTQQKTDE